MNINNVSSEKQDKNDVSSYVGYGVAFGLIGGALFSTIIGMFFRFPLIWSFGPGFGMLVGIVVGAVMDSNRKS